MSAHASDSRCACPPESRRTGVATESRRPTVSSSASGDSAIGVVRREQSQQLERLQAAGTDRLLATSRRCAVATPPRRARGRARARVPCPSRENGSPRGSRRSSSCRHRSGRAGRTPRPRRPRTTHCRARGSRRTTWRTRRRQMAGSAGSGMAQRVYERPEAALLSVAPGDVGREIVEPAASILCDRCVRQRGVRLVDESRDFRLDLFERARCGRRPLASHEPPRQRDRRIRDASATCARRSPARACAIATSGVGLPSRKSSPTGLPVISASPNAPSTSSRSLERVARAAIRWPTTKVRGRPAAPPGRRRDAAGAPPCTCPTCTPRCGSRGRDRCCAEAVPERSSDWPTQSSTRNSSKTT